MMGVSPLIISALPPLPASPARKGAAGRPRSSSGGRFLARARPSQRCRSREGLHTKSRGDAGDQAAEVPEGVAETVGLSPWRLPGEMPLEKGSPVAQQLPSEEDDVLSDLWVRFRALQESLAHSLANAEASALAASRFAEAAGEEADETWADSTACGRVAAAKGDAGNEGQSQADAQKATTTKVGSAWVLQEAAPDDASDDEDSKEEPTAAEVLLRGGACHRDTRPEALVLTETNRPDASNAHAQGKPLAETDSKTSLLGLRRAAAVVAMGWSWRKTKEKEEPGKRTGKENGCPGLATTKVHTVQMLQQPQMSTTAAAAAAFAGHRQLARPFAQKLR